MRKRADRAEREDTFASLRKVAKAFEGFKPAREVLKRVSAVPTCFVQFDHATKVGGLPIERISLLHGPSGEGKTAYTLGLVKSFLQRGHLVFFIDAERTTPITWAEKVMAEHADHPFFFASRPESYEQTTEDVRKFCQQLIAQREAGNLPENTSALFICDSIRKLVPKDLAKKIAADVDKHGLDGASGRGAQWKAAMNSQWMDELVPMLEEARAAFVVIARETDDGEASKWEKLAGTDYKVGGGKALYYDSSMVIRVSRSKYILEKDEPKATVFGEKHLITIRKTKVSGHEEKQTICYFHTSNGVFTPFGFDMARDLVDLGERFGVVERKGAWFNFGDVRLGQGMHNAVKKLTEDAEIMSAVDAAVRLRFDSENPIEVTEDGEVLS